MEKYVEKWTKRNSTFTSHTYDDYGKRQFTISQEWYERDDNGEIVISSESQLEFLLKQSTDLYDGHEDSSYTKEEINQELENFRKRKNDFIRKNIRSKKRKLPMATSIADLIK